jgi:hypothetical protein
MFWTHRYAFWQIKLMKRSERPKEKRDVKAAGSKRRVSKPVPKAKPMVSLPAAWES